jgi:calcineurin-like phosphoesterase family protein
MLEPYVEPGRPLTDLRAPGWWVCSDTHFLHRRLQEALEPARRELDRDQDELMAERWMDTVGENDTVVHLGDVALGKNADFQWISDILPGRKFMLRGNHDHHSRVWYERHGFTLVPEFWLEYGGWRIRFTHRPDDARRYVCYPKTLNAHGHIHSKVRADRRLLNLSMEAIDYRPLWLTDVLDARISELEGAGRKVAGVRSIGEG